MNEIKWLVWRSSLLILAGVLLSIPVLAREEDPIRYVVTLETSREPFVLPLVEGISRAQKQLRIYVTSFRRRGVTLFRLRLGFFASRQQAEKVLAGMKSHYPSAWATRISKREKRYVMSGKINSQLTTLVTLGQ